METEINDFEAILRASLQKTNEAFDRADADLHEVVTEASAALEKVTDGCATLELTPSDESEKGIAYVLNAKWNSSKVKTLQGYVVTASGYPVLGGPVDDPYRILVQLRQAPAIRLKDKGELKAHFAEMITNPDSNLITYVAYQLRRKSDDPDEL